MIVTPFQASQLVDVGAGAPFIVVSAQYGQFMDGGGQSPRAHPVEFRLQPEHGLTLGCVADLFISETCSSRGS